MKMKERALINTQLQLGDQATAVGNRFNGFDLVLKTVETVPHAHTAFVTPLKWGVNESRKLVSKISQGGSFFATLGFGPESLWDSKPGMNYDYRRNS